MKEQILELIRTYFDFPVDESKLFVDNRLTLLGFTVLKYLTCVNAYKRSAKCFEYKDKLKALTDKSVYSSAGTFYLGRKSWDIDILKKFEVYFIFGNREGMMVLDENIKDIKYMMTGKESTGSDFKHNADFLKKLVME